jgi:hypothetical protein
MINKKRDDQIMFFFYPTEMDVPVPVLKEACDQIFFYPADMYCTYPVKAT